MLFSWFLLVTSNTPVINTEHGFNTGSILLSSPELSMLGRLLFLYGTERSVMDVFYISVRRSFFSARVKENVMEYKHGCYDLVALMSSCTYPSLDVR